MSTSNITGLTNQVPQEAQQQKRQPKRRSTRTTGATADILDRRNESRRYMQINYWDEFEDAYRATKCRTKPIMRIDPKTGNEVEDKTRTNVAMPELSLIAKRKTARLTANPPQINYTVGSANSGPNNDLGQRLTAWAFQQFDRSGEAQEHRKMVQTGVTFGFSVSKLMWDTVEVRRRFFRSMDSGNFYSIDRGGLMQLGGAPDDEIQDAVKEQGSALSDGELVKGLAKYGNSVQIQQKLTRFEGPVSKNVFIGDHFFEPGAADLNVSGWNIENYFETDRWLDKMSLKTYLADDGVTELPVFDPQAVQELRDMPSWQPIYMQQPFDLRSRLRTNSLGQTLPLWPTKLLKGKRYDVLECHTCDKDGQFWIEWIGNEKVYLGKMPYPWDLYGKSCFTSFVPLFDILSAIGDSSPRMLRWLWLLHNSVVGSRRDLVNAILRPLMKAKSGVDIPDEQVDRALFRVIQLRDMNDLQPLLEPLSVSGAISAATEEEAQVMRMLALADPNLTNVETGTESNPQAGKTATTAVLAAKSADALTQFEMDSLSWYLKESGEKKLAMLQQTEPESTDDGYNAIRVGPAYAKNVEGLTQRYGKAATINIDFMEIQQEIEIEPEPMSMLSVDDDIRRNAASQLATMAAQMPGVVDPQYAAKTFASTIRGVDPDKAVPPPKPPSPPPPKVNVSVAVKYDELPADVQAQVLSAGGVQVTPQIQQELGMQDTLKGIGKLSEASNHAANLMSNVSPEADLQSQEPETNLSRGVNG